LVVDGATRSVLVHVPSGISAGARVPLLLALHGFGGNGPQMERYSGLSRIADRHAFIAAYPSSQGHFWNSTAARGLPSDIHFLSDAIAYLTHRFCIDPGRVFATGVSNGGGMVALAACRLSDQIDAIASVAGGYADQPPCRPRRPVSVLEIHGTADQVVGYFGTGVRRTRGLPPFVTAWARRDRCSLGPTPRHIAIRTTLYRWTGCAGGVTVEHIRIRGGKHQWPGANPPDPGPRATICASCVVWRFFSSLQPGARRFSARVSSGGSGL
jgi:polyhydroxybutyrate depolymerase